MTNDMVNQPQHYKSSSGMETIDVIRSFSDGMTPLEAIYWANVVKYILRFKKKNGKQDLEKAKVYLDWLINEV